MRYAWILLLKTEPKRSFVVIRVVVMGQTLSEPVREKHSTEGADDRLYYGASCMQGWRISMEDAHTTILQLEDGKRTSFFGVYDGHGGQRVAEYSGRMLHQRIAQDDAYIAGNYKAALKNGYIGLDIDIRNGQWMRQLDCRMLWLRMFAYSIYIYIYA